MLEFERQPEPGKEYGVMSFREYASQEHSLPYLYAIEGKEKRVSYFGSDHIHDPSHPQFAEIEKQYELAGPDLVLVEGRTNLQNISQDELRKWLNTQSREGIIEEQGEAGFAMKLAASDGVDIVSPEPTFASEVDFLLQKGFSKEEIFVFYVTRDLSQLLRLSGSHNVEDYIVPMLKEYERELGWGGFSFSYQHFLQIAQRVWPDRDLEMVESELVDPTIFQDEPNSRATVVNEIARNSSMFRDSFMVQRIKQLLEKYNKIFIVYGASHAVMQEPAIRKILENEK